ncbi:TonB-dependent receptor [Rhizorhabdus wittichii]|uniref:TonB-dependent receptor n=1 Tax=Rhizorhabdus wittichii TaxID=160791 RepID=A0A975D2W5_9SPHN|nr:TonB-dependent receptor [Rhizorhabdus wittichii]QTH21668.1 TonB-dependent receptor [Rhizorhabdus wittichii]
MLKRPMLIAVSGVVLMGGASAAGAQNAAPSAATDGGGLEDIVVTAERVESRTQKSALSITAVEGNALDRAGVTKVTDIVKLIPGLEIASAGTLTQVYIRGVGANASSSYAEGAVAVNLDQAYIARPTAIGGSFFDLERVEVVKGPQGTLYGRNATGGAMNIVTRKPKLGELSVEGLVEVGNYDAFKLNAAINVPLSDVVAARVAGQYVKHDGYLSDGYNDDDSLSLRGHLLFEPSDDFSILLSSDYYRQKGMGQSYTIASQKGDWIGPSDPRSQALFSAAAVGRYGPALGNLIPLPQGNGYVDNDTIDVRATLTWNLGFADLTVVPDYRRSKVDTIFYPNGVLGAIDDVAKQRSLEARLSNKSDRLTWVVGGYYFHETQDTFYSYTQGLFNQEVYADLDSKNFAFFGQATYSITPELRLTGGARYTKEDKTQRGTVFCSSLFCPVPNVRVPFTGDLSFDNISWKVGAEFDVGPRSMAYANISRGYKGGGFSPIVAPNTFGTEKLTAYTIGIKNRFLDNRLQLNIEGFYWDYIGQQVGFLSSGQVAPGVLGSVFVTENIGKSTIKGLDMDVAFQATSGIRLGARIGYLDATADDFVYTPASVPFSACAISGAAPRVNVNCSGRTLPRSPKWSGTLTYDQTIDLPNDGAVLINVSSRFSTSYWGSIFYLPEHKQDSYTRTDLSLTYMAPGKHWSLGAFVNNIEDKAVLTVAGTFSLARVDYVNLQPPRTYGLRATVNF